MSDLFRVSLYRDDNQVVLQLGGKRAVLPAPDAQHLANEILKLVEEIAPLKVLSVESEFMEIEGPDVIP